MKIKLLLIIGIYFLSINNTYANSIDNLEISPSEQWMVENLLEKILTCHDLISKELNIHLVHITEK